MFNNAVEQYGIRVVKLHVLTCYISQSKHIIQLHSDINVNINFVLIIKSLQFERITLSQSKFFRLFSKHVFNTFLQACL